MFALTLNLKKIIKYFFITVIILFIFIIVIKIFANKIPSICNIIGNKSEKIIASEITLTKSEKVNLEKGIELILNSELPVQFVEGKNIELENNNDDNNVQEEAILPNLPESEDKVEETRFNNVVEEIKKSECSVNSDKNMKESYNVLYGSTKIKNESKYTLTNSMLEPNVEYNNKKDIFIFHTHTCESYTQTNANKYISTGNYRTTDLRYSVAGVGETLKSNLTNKGFDVLHDQTYHDYPAYTGSYSRSLITAQNKLKDNPGIQMVIDLHRDALGNNSNYGPTVTIDNERVAQLMFVIGTNGGGLEHPNWNTNLKFAIKIQEKANELYPGLFRPIIVRNSRYNQQIADSAFIIEVGATGNTLEECNASMKYLSNVLENVMN